MDIEQAVKTIKVLIGLEEFNKLSYIENKAIETLLTAYEKEKVSRKVMQDNWSQNVRLVEELKAELEKEKEKNKELIKQHAIEITDVDGNSIRIDLDGKIHNVYKVEEE